MFEIFIFVPNGKGAKKPSFTTENPILAADIVCRARKLFECGVVDYIYVYYDKKLIEHCES